MATTGQQIFAFILIVIGISILFDIDLMRFLVPAILIFLGIRLLTQGNTPQQNQIRDSLIVHEEVAQGMINENISFSGQEKKYVTNDFRGGKFSSTFAGGTIDLRQAHIKDNQTVEMEVNAMFGGVKILVPPTWNVNSSVTGVFGGFTNNTRIPDKKEEEGRLVVKGSAVFGGGEVTN